MQGILSRRAAPRPPCAHMRTRARGWAVDTVSLRTTSTWQVANEGNFHVFYHLFQARILSQHGEGGFLFIIYTKTIWKNEYDLGANSE